MNKTYAYNKFFIPNSFEPNEIQGSIEKLESCKCQGCGSLAFEFWFCIFCEMLCCNKCKDTKSNIMHPNCQTPQFRKASAREKSIMNEIKLRCKNEGCNNFINYLDYPNHMKTCHFRLCHCLNTPCTFTGISDKLEEHSNMCEYRRIKCTFCGEVKIFKDMQTHLAQCPEVLIRCKICEQPIKRAVFSQHDSTNAACLKSILKKKVSELEADKHELSSKYEKLKDEHNDLIKKYNKLKQEKKVKAIKRKDGSNDEYSDQEREH